MKVMALFELERMLGRKFPYSYLVMLGDTTLSDIKNKKLKYCYNQGSTHPAFHVKRIGKFIEHGYSIDIKEVIHMCERVVEEKDSPQLDYDDSEF